MRKYEGDKLLAVHSFTVFPTDMNYSKSLFGGKVMAEMDIAGVKVVRRALYDTGADGCVTACFERVDFKNPGREGDLIKMIAEIKSFGKSSINVRIKVSRESISGEIEDICEGNATFVATKEGIPFPHGLCFDKFKKTESINEHKK